MHDSGPTVSPYNGHMLRNLSKYYLFICCNQGNSTHFCHFFGHGLCDRRAGGFESHALGTKKKGLHHWRPHNSVVGDEGCPRAAGVARAPLRSSRAALEKRFAFPQLRTLAGSNPMRWARKRKGPHRWRPNNSVVGDEGCPRAASPPALASGLRPSRAALENASRFLSSAPWRVRIPCAGPKKGKAPIAGSLFNQVVGDEGFEPPALCV